MPIQLSKTLQGVTYLLYITTEIKVERQQDNLHSVRVVQLFYESKGHFDDSFLPIIRKEITITNQQRVNSIIALLRDSYSEALSVAENFLVNNVAYYQGGTVVNGVL